MNHDYSDIRGRISEPPTWWDEHAVPRYGKFHPSECADIYADEAALVLITCQECGKEYLVAFTLSSVSKVDKLPVRPELLDAFWKRTLADDIRDGSIHYGDPPNACDEGCAAGATMNSEPVRVLEYWRKEAFAWVRDPSLEIAIP